MQTRKVRKEGRRNYAALIRAVVLGVALWCEPSHLAAQPAGTWGVPFNHELVTTGATVPNPNATDHLVPFGGYANTGISYYSAFGYAFNWPGQFNAVHMALLPKGPHQGKVLVFGATTDLAGAPVLITRPAAT